MIIKYLNMKHIVIVFALLCFIAVGQNAYKPLSQPQAIPFVDDTEAFALAEKETFTLPITTRTITHKLEMYPQVTDECWFSSEQMLYKSLGSTSFMEDEQARIVNMLPLSKKQKLFLVDQERNIFSYSLDQHFLLKKLSPKTNFAGLNQRIETSALTAKEDQQIVYFITPEKYYMFTVDSLGLQIIKQQSLPGDAKDVQKAFVYQEYLFLLSAQSGLLIYKIDKETNHLALAQSFQFSKDLYFTDMKFQSSTQMLYLLAATQPVIKIYHFKPSQFPNPDKTLTILQLYDSINFSSVTNKHSQEVNEHNQHISIELSHQRQQQTIMVLFLHRYHYVVAELVYNVNMLTWSFVRYFKFSMMVNEIHLIGDIMAVVGGQSMGIFPYGIHPRLIDEEFNGQMRMTSMKSMKILPNGRFVGLTKGSIEYGVVKLQQKAEVNCKISAQSTLKTVKIKANLTACTNQDRQLYETYCAYEKTFVLQEMQLTVSAPLANILWTGMLFFLLLIVLGIIILFAMQRNKEEEIKRLEQYFDQKRRRQNEQPPPSSERRTFSNMM